MCNKISFNVDVSELSWTDLEHSFKTNGHFGLAQSKCALPIQQVWYECAPCSDFHFLHIKTFHLYCVILCIPRSHIPKRVDYLQNSHTCMNYFSHCLLCSICSVAEVVPNWPNVRVVWESKNPKLPIHMPRACFEYCHKSLLFFWVLTCDQCHGERGVRGRSGPANKCFPSLGLATLLVSSLGVGKLFLNWGGEGQQTHGQPLVAKAITTPLHVMNLSVVNNLKVLSPKWPLQITDHYLLQK